MEKETENTSNAQKSSLDISAKIISVAELESEEEKQSFKELPDLPPSFFRDYLEYGSSTSYAYSAYHFGTALGLISFAAGRKLVVRSSNSEFYPNVWIMCVGQTSTSGKSTACKLMEKKFLPMFQVSGAAEKLLRRLTPQALIQYMSTVSHRAWCYDDCGEFFADIRNKWETSIIGTMCTLYDGEQVSYGLAKAKGKESEFIVEKPSLTCVWNTTDSDIREQVRASEATNGFLPRWMWFWCHIHNETKINRDETEEDRKREWELKKQLQMLLEFFNYLGTNSKYAKFVEANPRLEDAIQFGTDTTIEEWKRSSDKLNLGEEYNIISSRLFPQAYKIAMLFTIMDAEFRVKVLSSESLPFRTKIPEKYAKLAVEICEQYLRPRALYVLECTKKLDERNTQERVRKVLLKFSGIINLGKLQRETHINSRPLDEALDSMERSGEIKRLHAQPPAGGKAGAPVCKILLVRDPDRNEV